MQPQSPNSNHRILVVDDNPAIHSDFRKILCQERHSQKDLDLAEAELFGPGPGPSEADATYELCSAHQGEEAVKLVSEAVIAKRRFALAFVDVRMPPGMDGIQTTARLWAADPELQVVICTAYSDYSWEQMVAHLGHSDRLVLLKKPFDTVEVLQLASSLTEKWRLLQATKQRMEDLEVLVSERTKFLRDVNEELGAEVAQRKRREASLRLQNEIIGTLAAPSAPAETLVRNILRIICERLGWNTGRLWLADITANRLRCSAIYRRDGQTVFRSQEQQRTACAINWPGDLQAGEGVPGEAWRSGHSHWFVAGMEAAKDGLPEPEAVFAFALRVEGSTTGVLEFRGRDSSEWDQELMQALETVGSLIGHALEKRKLEEQLRHSQKMDAIGHLAGGVAHDFNNILTIIRGYGELLKDKPGLENDVVDGLKNICLAADRAALLTRQLLTFSRKQIMQPKSLDLNHVIRQTEGMLRRVIRENVSVVVSCTDEPAVITADEGMIVQVLMNLACNARDAMPEGGAIRIETSLVVLDENSLQDNAEARPGEFICLSVEDTGTGIQADHLPHIFEPFFTTKEIGHGTGLGLCTVHGIVKQHHGWVEVDTQPGQGTRFRAFLPHSVEPAMCPEADRVRIVRPASGETVLLVEDEAPVRALAREILVDHGYRVLEAASGREALSMWRRHAQTVDMLLTDIVMPDGISGTDLAIRLRAREPDLPVLLVSGYSPGDYEGRTELPQASFLPKPYDPQKLIETVRHCLDRNKSPTCLPQVECPG